MNHFQLWESRLAESHDGRAACADAAAPAALALGANQHPRLVSRQRAHLLCRRHRPRRRHQHPHPARPRRLERTHRLDPRRRGVAHVRHHVCTSFLLTGTAARLTHSFWGVGTGATTSCTCGSASRSSPPPPASAGPRRCRASPRPRCATRWT